MASPTKLQTDLDLHTSNSTSTSNSTTHPNLHVDPRPPLRPPPELHPRSPSRNQLEDIPRGTNPSERGPHRNNLSSISPKSMPFRGRMRTSSGHLGPEGTVEELYGGGGGEIVRTGTKVSIRWSIRFRPSPRGAFAKVGGGRMEKKRLRGLFLARGRWEGVSEGREVRGGSSSGYICQVSVTAVHAWLPFLDVVLWCIGKLS